MQSNPLAQLSIQQLQQAVAIREQIDRLAKDLDGIAGGPSSSAAHSATANKRELSRAAKARISAAMKARWAKRKGLKHLASGSLPVLRAPRLATARAAEPFPRGHLKEQIIRTLKTSGSSGRTVKDLATKLGTSYGNINVWFRTTAKGVKEIKKVAPARFAWVS